MKKIITIVLITLFISGAALAQKNVYAISWEVNFPNNENYISKTSFTGGKIEYRHIFPKNFSIGLAMNWATYEEYSPRRTLEKPDGSSAITSDYIVQAYQLPITATAHYYFKSSKLLHPYAGIAIGGQYMEQSLYYNVYVSDDNNWGFVVRPEVGVLIKPDKFGYWGILIGASYSYSTNKIALLNEDKFSNIGLSLGVAFGGGD
jgi:outer membrane protein W